MNFNHVSNVTFSSYCLHEMGRRENVDQEFVDCSCGLKVGCGMVVKALDDNLCDILMVSISFASAQSRHCHLCSLEVNSL